MPAYTDTSISVIEAPPASGVLSDEQYSALSPVSYKLDTAIEKYQKTLETITENINTFSINYNISVENIADNLGVKFFSINNLDIRLVDSEKELTKVNRFIDNLLTQLEEILSTMKNINGKLDQVENSLEAMNQRYHERQAEINNERENYNRQLLQCPKKNNYFEDRMDQYSIDYEAWQSKMNIISEKIRSLEKRLTEDSLSTRNSIHISWFCKENEGRV